MVTAADDVYHLEKESHFSSFFDFIGDEPPPQQHWEEDIHSSNNSNTNNEENYLTEEPSTTTNDDEEEVDFGINYFLAASQEQQQQQQEEQKITIHDIQTVKSFLNLLVQYLNGKQELTVESTPDILKLVCKYLYHQSEFSLNQHVYTVQLLHTIVTKLLTKTFTNNVLGNARCFDSVKYTLFVIQRYCISIIQQQPQQPQDQQQMKLSRQVVDLFITLHTSKVLNDVDVKKRLTELQSIPKSFTFDQLKYSTRQLSHQSDNNNKNYSVESNDMRSTIHQLLQLSTTTTPSRTDERIRDDFKQKPIEKLRRFIRSYMHGTLNIPRQLLNVNLTIVPQLLQQQQQQPLTDHTELLKEGMLFISHSIHFFSMPLIQLTTMELTPLLKSSFEIYSILLNRNEGNCVDKNFVADMLPIVFRENHSAGLEFCAFMVNRILSHENVNGTKCEILATILHIAENLLLNNMSFGSLQTANTGVQKMWFLSSPVLDQMYPTTTTTTTTTTITSVKQQEQKQEEEQQHFYSIDLILTSHKNDRRLFFKFILHLLQQQLVENTSRSIGNSAKPFVITSCFDLLISSLSAVGDQQQQQQQVKQLAIESLTEELTSVVLKIGSLLTQLNTCLFCDVWRGKFTQLVNMIAIDFAKVPNRSQQFVLNHFIVPSTNVLIHENVDRQFYSFVTRIILLSIDNQQQQQSSDVIEKLWDAYFHSFKQSIPLDVHMIAILLFLSYSLNVDKRESYLKRCIDELNGTSSDHSSSADVCVALHLMLTHFLLIHLESAPTSFIQSFKNILLNQSSVDWNQISIADSLDNSTRITTTTLVTSSAKVCAQAQKYLNEELRDSVLRNVLMRPGKRDDYLIAIAIPFYLFLSQQLTSHSTTSNRSTTTTTTTTTTTIIPLLFTCSSIDKNSIVHTLDRVIEKCIVDCENDLKLTCIVTDAVTQLLTRVANADKEKESDFVMLDKQVAQKTIIVLYHLLELNQKQWNRVTLKELQQVDHQLVNDLQLSQVIISIAQCGISQANSHISSLMNQNNRMVQSLNTRTWITGKNQLLKSELLDKYDLTVVDNSQPSLSLVSLLIRHGMKSRHRSEMEMEIMSLSHSLTHLLSFLQLCTQATFNHTDSQMKETIGQLPQYLSIVSRLLQLSVSHQFSFVSEHCRNVLRTVMDQQTLDDKELTTKIQLINSTLKLIIPHCADHPTVVIDLLTTLEIYYGMNPLFLKQYFKQEETFQQLRIQDLLSLIESSSNVELQLKVLSLLNRVVKDDDDGALSTMIIDKWREMNDRVDSLFHTILSSSDLLQQSFTLLLERIISAISNHDDNHEFTATTITRIYHLLLKQLDGFIGGGDVEDPSVQRKIMRQFFTVLKQMSIHLRNENEFATHLISLLNNQLKMENNKRNYDFITLSIHFFIQCIPTASNEKHSEERSKKIQECLDGMRTIQPISATTTTPTTPATLNVVSFNTGVLSVEDEEDQDLRYTESLNPTLLQFNQTFSDRSQNSASTISRITENQRRMIETLLLNTVNEQEKQQQKKIQLSDQTFNDLLNVFTTILLQLQSELFSSSTSTSGDKSSRRRGSVKWSLSTGTTSMVVHNALTVSEDKSIYPASTFKSDVVFDRRQERSAVEKCKIPYQLIASNYNDFFAVGEETNITLTSTSSACGSLTPKSATRSSNFIPLSTASVPFKITHMRFNAENDRFLAVAGVFETHVFVFSDKGEAVQQIPIYLALEDMPNETFVLDIQWLPGSQVLLSIITNRFIKVYDLANDTFCPVFNFSPADDSLIIGGTFGLDEHNQPLLYALTQEGQLYYQEYLDSGGPCFFTQTVDISQISGGSGCHGASLYYSLLLETLFVSFKGGNTFACKVNLKDGSLIESKIICASGTTDSGSTLAQLSPFSHWTEAPDLPGVLLCVSQQNHASVIALQFTSSSSDQIQYEECNSGGSQVNGLIGIRRCSSTDSNSSFAFITKDGTLKHRMFTSTVVPVLSLPPNLRIFKLKKRESLEQELLKQQQSTSNSIDGEEESGDEAIDAPPLLATLGISDKVFIDQTDISTKVKYTSTTAELMNSYSSDTLLTKLTHDGADDYITSPSANGFELTVENCDVSATVMCRIQIQVGKHSASCIPKTIRINNGSPHSTQANTEQWIDVNMPILTCSTDKTLTIQFSESHDANNAPIVDRIHVFGVSGSKHQFESAKLKLMSNRDLPYLASLPPQQQQPLVQKKAQPASAHTIIRLLLGRLFTSYYLSTEDNNKPQQQESSQMLHKAISQVFSYPQLDKYITCAIATLVPFTNYSSDELKRIVDQYVISYVDQVNIDELTPVHLEYVFKQTNALLLTSPNEFLKIVEAYQTLPQKLLNKFEETRAEELIPVDVIIYSISGTLIMQMYSNILNNRLEDSNNNSNKHLFNNYLKPLLLDEDELVRMETTKTIAHMIQSCSLLSEDANIYDQLLISLINYMIEMIPLTRLKTSLTVVNFYHLLLFVMSAYLSKSMTTTTDQDKKLIVELVGKIVSMIVMDDASIFELARRCENSEVRLISLLFLTELLGIRAPTSDSDEQWRGQLFVSELAQTLHSIGVIDSLFRVLSDDIASEFERDSSTTNVYSDIMGGFLKPQKEVPDRDFSPLLSKYYCEENKGDLFKPYFKLLVQVLFQMVYAIVYINSSNNNKTTTTSQTTAIQWSTESLNQWNSFLSSLALNKHSKFIKERAKEFLVKINGGVEIFNTITDMSLYESELLDFTKPLESVSSYSQDRAVKLIGNLDAAIECARQRPENWIDFCAKNPTIYSSLFQFSFHFSDDICCTPLKLLNFAISDKNTTLIIEQLLTHDTTTTTTNSNSNGGFSRFIDEHALSCNSSIVRVDACTLLSRLISTLYQQKQQQHQAAIESLLNVILVKIQDLPFYGIKSEQFMNIVLVTLASTNRESTIVKMLTENLKQQNEVVAQHSNVHIYNALSKLIQIDGYYLESNPCFVCNDPEVPYSTLSFSSIKQNIKFEHSTQYLQFTSSYTMNQIHFHASNTHRKKQVRTLEFYYNNKHGLSVGELKEPTTIWKKLGSLTVPRSSTSATLNLSIPVTAVNLLVEFSSFYEDLLASDQLMCTGCNIPVLDKHGLCHACHENAYQCSKCHHINYAVLDCFQCPACGHSRYGTFAFSFSAKQSFAIIGRIHDDSDAKKAIETIENHLEIAQSKYNELTRYKDTIQQKLNSLESGNEVNFNDNKVNSSIESLVQLYSTETHSAYKQLSTSVKILATTRKELVRYIHRNPQKKVNVDFTHVNNMISDHHSKHKKGNTCFGCANKYVKLCLHLFRQTLQKVSVDSCIHELVNSNIRHGISETKDVARLVLCNLVKSNVHANSTLISLLKKKIEFTLQNYKDLNVAAYIGNEMKLLAELNHESIQCFESHIAFVFEVLLKAVSQGGSNLAICEQIIIPCLQILNRLLTTETNVVDEQQQQQQQQQQVLTTDQSPQTVDDTIKYKYANHALVDFRKWTNGDVSITDWIHKNKQSKAKGFESIQVVNESDQQQRTSVVPIPVNAHLIKGILLNSTSKATRRQMKDLLMNLCKASPDRELELLKVICFCLPVAMEAREAAEEFFTVFSTLIATDERKYYLSTGGYLTLLCDNLNSEVKRIEEAELVTTSTTDLTQGFTLQKLVQIISSLLQIPEIITTFKEKESHIASILSAFLSLRTIIVQKTSLTTDSCEMLRELTDKLQVTDKDKQLFITACMDALKTRTDNYTAIFVFERLCNMIVPYKEPPSYLINMKKHRAQEFFFQGNMRGNPYDSKQIGTKMSDIATKILKDMDICADFQLELLVRNKIVNLNLDISAVYEQVWRQANVDEEEEESAMDVIFRFQGVDGEATEDVVDTLNSEDEEANLDEKCKITVGMNKRGGLELVLDYLRAITDVQSDKLLVKYILQFLFYCTKVKRNRRRLLMVDAVELLLKKCKFVFSNTDTTDLAEMILLIIKPIVEEATRMSYETVSSPLTPLSPLSSTTMMHTSSSASDLFMLNNNNAYKKSTDETLNQLTMFLDRLPSMSPKIVDAVSKVLPFLTYGEQDSIMYLVDHFASHLNFDKYDTNKDSTFYMNTFVKVVHAIPNDVAGNHLKSAILNKGITAKTFDYINQLFPVSKENSSEEWLNAYEKPGVPMAINLLQGLCMSHPPSQSVILERNSGVIRMLHKLEENTHAKEIAALSEGLLNAIAENGFEVSARVNQIRSKTKNRKQKKASKTRDSVLKAFGMNIGSKGEIKQQQEKKSSSWGLDDLSSVEEEQGLTCCVCGDGHSFKPNELLGVYNYAKVHSFGDFTGFASVTSFSIIHLECHNNAVVADSKLKPPKSEWEGALIRNGFSQCNCLLPILGPQNAIDQYTTALEKYWEQLAQLKSISERFKTLTLDVSSLVAKFAKIESLSVDSGGGSTSHNMRMLPFEIQVGLFLLENDDNERRKYEDCLNEFLSSENQSLSTVSDLSAFYNLVLSLFLMNFEEWNHWKPAMLTKLFNQLKQDLKSSSSSSSTTTTTTTTTTTATSTIPPDQLFNLCRAPLMFIAIIDQFQRALKSTVSTSDITTSEIHHSKDSKWITEVKNKLRNDQMNVVNAFEKIADEFYVKLKSCNDLNSLLELTGVKNDQFSLKDLQSIMLTE